MTVAELIATLSLKSDKSSFAAGEKLVGTIKKAIAGIVAFKTVDAFAGMVSGVSKTADHFSKLSKQVGVAIEPLQQLNYVAGLSGVELGVLSGGLRKLAKNAHDAATGGKQQADTFKALGISLKGADGQLRPVEDLLGDVAERISKMPDGTKKTALAMEVFGKSGSTMIPMLNEGRGGIAKLRKEFVDLGGQIDGPTASAFEQFNDDQDRVKAAIQGFKNQIAIQLLPHLQKAATFVLEWVKANRELIAVKVKEFTDGLIKVLQRLWEILQGVWEVAKDLWPVVVGIAGAFKALSDAVGGVENAIKLMIAAWVAFKGLQLMSYLIGLAGKMTALGIAAKGVAPVVTNLGNGITMTMTGAKGSVLKGAAAFAGKAGLVGAALAAGYAIGTIADKMFDLSGKASDLMTRMFGALEAVESEAAKNDRTRQKKYEAMSDDELHARRHENTPEGRAAAQAWAARSAKRDTRPMSTATRPKGGKSGKVTQLEAKTNVTINMNSADPKEVEKAVKKATKGTFQDLFQKQMRDAAAATGEG